VPGAYHGAGDDRRSDTASAVRIAITARSLRPC